MNPAPDAAGVRTPSVAAPTDAEDEAWIREFQAGRERGFNRLVLKHKDRVYGLCLRLLAGDAPEAEDAAQEAFVRAYRGLPAFRMEAKFTSWIYRIAVNVCRNKMASPAWRASRRRGDPEEAERLEAAAPSPEAEMDERGRRARIEAAIARLPEDQRSLVVLRDVEGRSYEEIAAATGLNEGTVKSRLNRGRGQLRAWLKDCLAVLLAFALAWMKDHG